MSMYYSLKFTSRQISVEKIADIIEDSKLLGGEKFSLILTKKRLEVIMKIESPPHRSRDVAHKIADDIKVLVERQIEGLVIYSVKGLSIR